MDGWSADERDVAVRSWRIAGVSVERVCELTGLSQSQVYRIAGAKADGPKQSVLEDLEVLLASQELDEVGRVNASVARALASKLDKARASSVAQDSMAIPAIAKELRNVLEAIVEISSADREWVQGLFQ